MPATHGAETSGWPGDDFRAAGWDPRDADPEGDGFVPGPGAPVDEAAERVRVAAILGLIPRPGGLVDPLLDAIRIATGFPGPDWFRGAGWAGALRVHVEAGGADRAVQAWYARWLLGLATEERRAITARRAALIASASVVLAASDCRPDVAADLAGAAALFPELGDFVREVAAGGRVGNSHAAIRDLLYRWALDVSESARRALLTPHFGFALAYAIHAALEGAVKGLYPAHQFGWPILRGGHEFSGFLLRDDATLLVLRDRPPGVRVSCGVRPWPPRAVRPRAGGTPEWFRAVRGDFGLSEADALFVLPLRVVSENADEVLRGWTAREDDFRTLTEQIWLNLAHHARLLDLPDPDAAMEGAKRDSAEGWFNAKQLADLLADAGETTRSGRPLTPNAFHKRIRRSRPDGADPYAQLARIKDPEGRFPMGAASRIVKSVAKSHGREIEGMREVVESLRKQREGLTPRARPQ